MSNMAVRQEQKGLEDKELEELLQRRSDLNAEVFDLFANLEYRQTLAKLQEIEKLDIELDGETANSTLFRIADAHAGLSNWPEAAKYSSTLKEQIKRQIAELKVKVDQGIPLTPAENININSLPQLLVVCETRFPLYRDYGQRLVSLRELMRNKLRQSGNNLQENVVDLRLKLFKAALPEALRGPIDTVIDLLCKKNEVTSKSGKDYREIVDVVTSYVVNYFSELDPENERSFIDTIFYEDIEPEEERSKLEKVENPLAWEERIKNRAQKIIQRKGSFIEENQEIFEGLKSDLERVFHYFD